jgi:glycosyltransferase involved in cell wall biosynthesis
MEFKNRLSNAFVFERSIKTADYIWTNSNYTKKCVQQYIPHRKCESIFVGCSIDDSLFYERSYTVDEQNVFLNKVGIDFPYILFVGTLEPRKNLKFLLEIAPAVFAKYGTKLVVVGAKGWKKTSVSDIVESSSYNQCAVHFCGYVSNEELVKLYHFARCFVSASLNEGFGMPQLEALKCGCPVITSHNSAMIEVAEDIEGAYTIKGYDAQQWITKIGDVISSNKQVSGNRISQYSWKTVLDNLIIYIS